jgi:SAM-dependent methyltransferase
MDKTWGINSNNQKIYDFRDKFNNEISVLEIGPGNGDNIIKIRELYCPKNVFCMQPENEEYSNFNENIRSIVGNDKFLETRLEDYIKFDNYKKFDIIYIFKFNINFAAKDNFFEALNKILLNNGIIYITSVEKERFHKYDKYYDCLWCMNCVKKYFKFDKSIVGVGNEFYGDIILKKL